MNYHLICSSATLCSFIATGCSTHTVNQTREVSTTAIAYTTYLNEFLENTQARVMELDTKHLVMSRSSDSRAKNEAMLLQKDQALTNWIAEAAQLRQQNILLSRYFSSLQAMVDDPVKNDMSDSLSNLSLTISEVNQIQTNRRNPFGKNRVLTEAQTSDVNSLGKILIGSHYSVKVKQILLRDSKIIDKQIALHADQIALLSKIYKRRVKWENKHHYANRVYGAYVDTSRTSDYVPDVWSQDRVQSFKNKEALTDFDNVKSANKDFREAWVNILQGKKDIGSTATTLGDINNFVSNTLRLKESFRDKRQTITVIPPTPQ